MTLLGTNVWTNEPVPATRNTDKIDLLDCTRWALQGTWVAPASAKTVVSGVVEVQTLTYPALADAVAGDHVILPDSSGNTWALGLDTTGSDPEPSSDAWKRTSVDRRAFVDISGATTAADVASAVDTAANLVTGFSAAFTSDVTAADGTMTITYPAAGPQTDAVPYNTDGTDVGTITVAETTAGTVGGVDASANILTHTAHGFFTGLKVATTTAGTLPGGLSATNYYVIRTSADSFKVASTLANALAGTAIDLTNIGSGTHTFTPASGTDSASAQLQKSADGVTWTDLGSAVAITGAGTNLWEPDSTDPVGYRYMRVAVALTTGQLVYSLTLSAKG